MSVNISFSSMYIFFKHFFLEGLSYDEEGQLMTRNQSSTFVVGGKSNNTVKGNPDIVIPILPPPKRNPDYVATITTNVDQAALYRLSGGNHFYIYLIL